MDWIEIEGNEEKLEWFGDYLLYDPDLNAVAVGELIDDDNDDFLHWRVVSENKTFDPVYALKITIPEI